MKKEETAKAVSLVRSGPMPMISAAMSMSRIAIQERPMRPRTRLLASQAIRMTKTRHEQVVRQRRGVRAGDDDAEDARGGAVIWPEAV